MSEVPLYQHISGREEILGGLATKSRLEYPLEEPYGLAQGLLFGLVGYPLAGHSREKLTNERTGLEVQVPP